MTSPIPLLETGDVLLYGRKPRDFFGLVTRIVTDSPAVHVEMYRGDGMSYASRNGIGVNSYPVRMEQLIAVLRPISLTTLQLKALDHWFFLPYKDNPKYGVIGRPYGWLDLLEFACNTKFRTDGWICSEFVANAFFQMDYHPFSLSFDYGLIDPGDFFKSPALHWIWVRPDVKYKLGY
jgi:hypothetical protein